MKKRAGALALLIAGAAGLAAGLSLDSNAAWLAAALAGGALLAAGYLLGMDRTPPAPAPRPVEPAPQDPALDRLAALEAQLTQAVVVCSGDGEILLCTGAARRRLPPEAAVGRPIYSFLDRDRLAHGLESLRHQAAEGKEHPATRLVMPAGGGELVSMRLEASAGGGFALLLDEAAARPEGQAQALAGEVATSVRASAANIRAAVEAIESFPEMEPERRAGFMQAIGEEAASLGRQAARLEADAERASAEPSGEDVRSDDLLAAAARRIEAKLALRVKVEGPPEPLWLRADSAALVQALAYLASRLAYEFETREVTLGASREGRFLRLTLLCSAVPLTVETWNSWVNQPLRTAGEPSPHSLTSILARHAGDSWYETTPTQETRLHLLLPLPSPPPAVPPSPLAGEGGEGGGAVGD